MKLQEQKGQVLVEFALVAPLLIFFIFYLFILGLWIYNSSQTDQAARIAARQCAWTGNSYEAKQEARDYLQKTIVLSKIKNIEVMNKGANASSKVTIEMETFLPGLKKLLDGSGWTGKVTIKKEATTVSEYRFRHPEEFN
ncbi:TadE-like protein [Desulfotomaculum arcticum]|uniref:TadE-like protein n=1 Tax=Desulfotruncus arcticus DSM 17038 TaxID=1121424 RepID=A0A1I2Z824_9FIRM|nr:TadE/TadG family type IV pilus assembly protein [Desulfotruncus arcticus]SFH34058.1 TadE-like protein [Desulfotomaculum arcticum] [Desulfotruncus arcticus DSM 17038]